MVLNLNRTYSRVCPCGAAFAAAVWSARYCPACRPSPRTTRPRWSEQDIAQLRQMAGVVNSREIGDRIGRSMSAVRWQAGQLGISLRCYGERHHKAKYPDALVLDILDLHDSGIGIKPLARMTGVGRGAIARFVNGTRGMAYENDQG